MPILKCGRPEAPTLPLLAFYRRKEPIHEAPAFRFQLAGQAFRLPGLSATVLARQAAADPTPDVVYNDLTSDPNAHLIAAYLTAACGAPLAKLPRLAKDV